MTRIDPAELARLVEKIAPQKCGLCAGTGKRMRAKYSEVGTQETSCPICKGTGEVVPSLTIEECRANAAAITALVAERDEARKHSDGNLAVRTDLVKDLDRLDAAHVQAEARLREIETYCREQVASAEACGDPKALSEAQHLKFIATLAKP